MVTYEFILPEAKVFAPGGVAFEDTLTRQYGGFTRWEAMGAWCSLAGVTEFENVMVFRVLALESERDALLALVLAYATKQGEKALYFGTAAEAEVYLTGN